MAGNCNRLHITMATREKTKTNMAVNEDDGCSSNGRMRSDSVMSRSTFRRRMGKFEINSDASRPERRRKGISQMEDSAYDIGRPPIEKKNRSMTEHRENTSLTHSPSIIKKTHATNESHTMLQRRMMSAYIPFASKYKQSRDVANEAYTNSKPKQVIRRKSTGEVKNLNDSKPARRRQSMAEIENSNVSIEKPPSGKRNKLMPELEFKTTQRTISGDLLSNEKHTKNVEKATLLTRRRNRRLNDNANSNNNTCVERVSKLPPNGICRPADGQENKNNSHGIQLVREVASGTNVTENDRDKYGRLLDLGFATFDHLLSSMITKQHVQFIGDMNIATALVEHGIGPGVDTCGYSRDLFQQVKDEKLSWMKQRQFTSEQNQVRDRRTIRKANLDIDKVFKNPVLRELAKREEQNRLGSLMSILLVRDYNSAGVEVSAFIDLAHRLVTEDWRPIFKSGRKVVPRKTDLSYMDWKFFHTWSKDSPNYEVLTNHQSGLRFRNRHDNKILNPGDSRHTDSSRIDVPTKDYLQVVSYNMPSRPTCIYHQQLGSRICSHTEGVCSGFIIFKRILSWICCEESLKLVTCSFLPSELEEMCGYTNASRTIRDDLRT